MPKTHAYYLYLAPTYLGIPYLYLLINYTLL